MNKGRRPSPPDEVPPRGVGAGRALPYVVELWDLTHGAPERVIGRAAALSVAETIFRAAVTAQPGRRIVLRRGAEVLRTS